MDDSTVADYWDRNAPAWIEGVRAGYDTRRQFINNPAFLSMLPDLSGQAVLDLGCGEGTNTRLIAGLGASVTAIDISPKLIEAAIEQERSQPLGIRYLVMSGSQMDDFADASFEAVVSTMTLMDMPDYEGCVRHVHRVLKPGGLFQFSVLHPLFLMRNFQWIADSEGRRTGAQIGDYFGLIDRTSRPDLEEWKFSSASEEYQNRVEPFRIPSFRRTLSVYVNTLTAGGFEILQLAEPYADEEAVKNDPNLIDSRILPNFLIFQCRKRVSS